MSKDKVKLYRVTAVQPVYYVTYVNATNSKDAELMCENDMTADNDVHDWEQIECGEWYDYQAEEVKDE